MRGFKECTSPGKQVVFSYHRICLIIPVLHFLFPFFYLLLTVRAGPRSALPVLQPLLPYILVLAAQVNALF